MRSGIVSAPQDYHWCSAKSHIDGEKYPVLWSSCFLTETVKCWEEYLRGEGDRKATDDVIGATKIGRPCGKEDFVKQMEALLGWRFTALPPGRPRKKQVDVDK